MDFDDLDTYNGDTEHDLWVDFDNYVICSELNENCTAVTTLIDKSYTASK